MVDDVSDPVMPVLERFVVLLYNRTSDQVSVNNARKLLFTQKSCSLENLPPTQAALVQHIKRTRYLANCCSRALFLDPSLPTGDGKKMMWDGNLCELLCQKLLSPVMN